MAGIARTVTVAVLGDTKSLEAAFVRAATVAAKHDSQEAITITEHALRP